VPQIQVLDAQGQSQQLVALNGDGLTVGRLAANSVVLNDAQISRHHLRLDWDGSQVTVTDLGSANGIFLAGARLLPHAPQVWDGREMLRVGPFWLRLLPAGPTVPSTLVSRPSGGALTPTMTATQLATTIGGSGGRIGVQLNELTLTLTPGQPGHLTVTITNWGNTVDHLTLSVEGIPPEWAHWEPAAVQLNPGSQAAVELVLTVPRTPASWAGRYRVLVRAQSRENPGEAGMAHAEWTVLPFSGGSLSLAPKQVSSQTHAAYKLTLHNESNEAAHYRFGGEDDKQALSYGFAPEQVELPPGAVAMTALNVGARQRWVGTEQPYTFTVHAHATGSNTSPAASGQFMHRALIPPWLLGLLVLLVPLCGAGGIWAKNTFVDQPATATAIVATDLRATTIAEQTQTALAATQTQVAQQTPTAVPAVAPATGSEQTETSPTVHPTQDLQQTTVTLTPESAQNAEQTLTAAAGAAQTAAAEQNLTAIAQQTQTAEIAQQQTAVAAQQKEADQRAAQQAQAAAQQTQAAQVAAQQTQAAQVAAQQAQAAQVAAQQTQAAQVAAQQTEAAQAAAQQTQVAQVAAQQTQAAQVAAQRTQAARAILTAQQAAVQQTQAAQVAAQQTRVALAARQTQTAQAAFAQQTQVAWAAATQTAIARENSARAWSDEMDLGGGLSSEPAVASWGANRLDVFYRGQNQHLWTRSWNGHDQGWGNEVDLGGVLTTAPAAVSRGPNQIDVFYSGQNGHLWTRWWDGQSWSGELDLGGVLTSQPTVASWGASRLDVFYRGQNQQLWTRSWNGQGWGNEADLGGVLTTAPAAVSRNLNQIDVFYRGQNLHLWTRWYPRAGG
jgi:hypothetical protein